MTAYVRRKPISDKQRENKTFYRLQSGGQLLFFIRQH